MKSKVAVLTGAAGGLGQALLTLLLRDDYRVFAVVRTASQERELFETDPARIIPVRVDLAEDSAQRVLAEHLAFHTDHVDLVIHCAGCGAANNGLENLSLTELHALINVHCYGSVRTLKACLPHLKAADAGTIVNISSRFGSIEWVATNTVPNAEATYCYRIAKAAMNMLTACVAAEFAGTNIRAFALDPGKLRTRFGPKDADTAPEAAAEAILALVHGREAPSAVFVNSRGAVIPW